MSWHFGGAPITSGNFTGLLLPNPFDAESRNSWQSLLFIDSPLRDYRGFANVPYKNHTYSYIHIDKPQLQIYIHRRTLNFTVSWRLDVKMCRVICHLISGSILNSDSAQVCIFYH